MVKKNFIDLVQTKVNEITGGEYSKKVSGDFVEAVALAIVDAIASGDTIRIDGLGTFGSRFQAGREGVSSFNGKKWKTDDTLVPTFKFSNSVKDTVADTYDPKKHKPAK